MDYDSMTVAELKELLRDAGMPADILVFAVSIRYRPPMYRLPTLDTYTPTCTRYV